MSQLIQLQGNDAYGKPHYYTYYSHFDTGFFGWLNGMNADNSATTLSFSIASTAPEDPRGFNALNNIQCNFTYVPDLFAVSVDRSLKPISSVPKNISGAPQLSYKQTLIYNLNQWMYVFTVSDNCVDGSQLARALVANSDRLRNSTTLSKDEVTLRATEDLLESLFDNINVLWITTRMVSHASDPIINGRREGIKAVPATVKIPSVIFGEHNFIVAIAVLNTIIVLAYLFELARTRVWAGLPPVDLANTSDMVISAAKGGIVFSEKDESADAHIHARNVSAWKYAQSEPFIDNTGST